LTVNWYSWWLLIAHQQLCFANVTSICMACGILHRLDGQAGVCTNHTVSLPTLVADMRQTVLCHMRATSIPNGVSHEEGQAGRYNRMTAEHTDCDCQLMPFGDWIVRQ
jgi:hypothetical protein